MSKIDDLVSTVARIEQKVDDIKPTLEFHSRQLEAHEINLNGSGEVDGLNEWRRNFVKDFQQRHVLLSGVVPVGIIIAWEMVKRKIVGHW